MMSARAYFTCFRSSSQLTTGIHRGGAAAINTVARDTPFSASFCATSPPMECPITMGFFSVRATSSASAI